MWRSLVAHLTGGQGVAGSNPVIPTIFMSFATPSADPFREERMRVELRGRGPGAAVFARKVHRVFSEHCCACHDTRLTYECQGRDFRLTDLHGAVVDGILA